MFCGQTHPVQSGDPCAESALHSFCSIQWGNKHDAPNVNAHQQQCAMNWHANVPVLLFLTWDTCSNVKKREKIQHWSPILQLFFVIVWFGLVWKTDVMNQSKVLLKWWEHYFVQIMLFGVLLIMFSVLIVFSNDVWFVFLSVFVFT